MLVQNSYAKINVFLKIIGKQQDYHALCSRFVTVYSLSDCVLWENDCVKQFTLVCESPTLSTEHRIMLEQDNIILKAKNILESYITPLEQQLLNNVKITLVKNIPLGSGLGGGSSNAATFLKMAQKQLGIHLSHETWMGILKQIGADVSFFWSEVASANVSGIGEHIQPFNEPPLRVEIITPPFICQTAKVYHYYSQKFLQNNPFNPTVVQQWSKTDSQTLLIENDLHLLNDLSLSAFVLYPKLKEYAQEGWFLSGSGSSFFRLCA